MKDFKALQMEIHTLAKSKGWYDGAPRNPLEMHALFHSEISEATECVRKGEESMYFTETGKPEGELVELADAVIRIMDYCELNGWDLGEAIEIKHEYNKTRSHRHGGKKY